MRLGWNRECVRFTRGRATVGREQRGDLLSDTRCVRIGHKQPEVIAKVGEGRLLLQFEEHLAQDARAARVERVDGQRTNVGVLNEVAPHARGEVRTVDQCAAYGGLG